MIPLPLLFVLAAAPAEPGELAARHFKQGEAAFARGDYTAAALAFERAYGLEPHASSLLNAAEAWERAGRRGRAIENCERVAGAPGTDAPQRQEAARRVARLQPKVARLSVEGPEGWTIEVDGEERRRLPVGVAVDPGSRSIVAFDETGARRDQRILDLSAGQRSALVFDLGPAAPPPAAEPPPLAEPPPIAAPLPSDLDAVSGGPPAASWIAFAVAGAALGATVVFGALTLDAKASYEEGPSGARADAFFDRRLGANLAGGVMLTSAAAGALLWWLGAE
jgi:tetratricopeptide (TPR) repeat protein